MAASTGPVLIAGGLAAVNEVLLGPLAGGKPPDVPAVFRLALPVTGLAVALGLLERAAPQFAVGLAWLLVAGVLILPPGGQPSILANVNKIGNF